MKCRILIDGERYYPQKKRLLGWKFYNVLIKPPYGNPAIIRECGDSLQDALEILEKNGVNTQNRTIFIRKGCADEWYGNHTATLAALTVGGMLFVFILLMKKWGMM